MIVRKPQKTSGLMALIYGETGVGKTVSTLSTLPKPILYIECDPKPVERTAGHMVDFTDIDILHPESFLDLFNYLNQQMEEIPKKYKSVVVDPLSFLVNVVLLGDIEDETARAEVFGNTRPLVSLGRTDIAGYGTLSSLAKRLCKTLGLIATQGVVVVCIALLDEMPKWNRELSAAPAFVGKDFNKDYPAFFDLIGLVQQRVDGDGNVLYPPMVTFTSDGSFIAKWSGKRVGKDVKGLLNWTKILAFEKEQREKEKEGKND